MSVNPLETTLMRCLPLNKVRKPQLVITTLGVCRCIGHTAFFQPSGNMGCTVVNRIANIFMDFKENPIVDLNA